ncbi:MAG: VOC family protein [Chloroflexota bacterium]
MVTETASVRYLVSDVPAAVDFYTRHLGFTVELDASPAFAAVVRGPLRLLLSGARSSAGRPMPDGSVPAPGGSQILLEDPSGNPVEPFQPG